MTEKAITPLRQRIIEDLTIRKFAPKTQGHDRMAAVIGPARFSVCFLASRTMC